MEDLGSQLVFLIAGAVGGAVIGLGLGEFARRPVLAPGGTGGGGGPNLGWANELRVTNPPAFMGFSIGPTVVFGRTFHRGLHIGIPIARNTARDVRASLYDRVTDEHIAGLWWRRQTAGGWEYPAAIDIGAGESGELMVFAWERQPCTEYFVFSPARTAPLMMDIPPAEQRFREARRFLVRLHYGHGGAQHVRSIRVEATQRIFGEIDFRMPAK
jgi:hypothetical protein